MCLYFQDNIDRAFACFQQVLRLAPDHAKALEIYKRAKNLKKKKEEGNAAYEKEQYEKAYKLYTEALTIDSQNILTNAKLHFNKATVAAKVLHFYILLNSLKIPLLILFAVLSVKSIKRVSVRMYRSIETR